MVKYPYPIKCQTCTHNKKVTHSVSLDPQLIRGRFASSSVPQIIFFFIHKIISCALHMCGVAVATVWEFLWMKLNTHRFFSVLLEDFFWCCYGDKIVWVFRNVRIGKWVLFCERIWVSWSWGRRSVIHTGGILWMNNFCGSFFGCLLEKFALFLRWFLSMRNL